VLRTKEKFTPAADGGFGGGSGGSGFAGLGPCFPRSQKRILTPATRTCRWGPRDAGHSPARGRLANAEAVRDAKGDDGVGLQRVQIVLPLGNLSVEVGSDLNRNRVGGAGKVGAI